MRRKFFARTSRRYLATSTLLSAIIVCFTVFPNSVFAEGFLLNPAGQDSVRGYSHLLRGIELTSTQEEKLDSIRRSSVQEMRTVGVGNTEIQLRSAMDSLYAKQIRTMRAVLTQPQQAKFDANIASAKETAKQAILSRSSKRQ